MAKDTNKSFLLFHTYSKTTESPPKKSRKNQTSSQEQLICTKSFQTFRFVVMLRILFFLSFTFFCLLQLPFLTFTDFKCPSVRAFFFFRVIYAQLNYIFLVVLKQTSVVTTQKISLFLKTLKEIFKGILKKKSFLQSCKSIL